MTVALMFLRTAWPFVLAALTAIAGFYYGAKVEGAFRDSAEKAKMEQMEALLRAQAIASRDAIEKLLKKNRAATNENRALRERIANAKPLVVPASPEMGGDCSSVRLSADAVRLWNDILQQGLESDRRDPAAGVPAPGVTGGEGADGHRSVPEPQ